MIAAKLCKSRPFPYHRNQSAPTLALCLRDAQTTACTAQKN